MTEPAYRPTRPSCPAYPHSQGADVPFLFRQSIRESVIDGAPAKVLRVGEQLPVGVRRLVLSVTGQPPCRPA